MMSLMSPFTSMVNFLARTMSFGPMAAMNDAMAGFSAQTDSVIEITGYRGNLSDLKIM